jgi:hypothetical protein
LIAHSQSVMAGLAVRRPRRFAPPVPAIHVFDLDEI